MSLLTRLAASTSNLRGKGGEGRRDNAVRLASLTRLRRREVCTLWAQAQEKCGLRSAGRSTGQAKVQLQLQLCSYRSQSMCHTLSCGSRKPSVFLHTLSLLTCLAASYASLSLQTAPLLTLRLASLPFSTASCTPTPVVCVDDHERVEIATLPLASTTSCFAVPSNIPLCHRRARDRALAAPPPPRV